MKEIQKCFEVNEMVSSENERRDIGRTKISVGNEKKCYEAKITEEKYQRKNNRKNKE